MPKGRESDQLRRAIAGADNAVGIIRGSVAKAGIRQIGRNCNDHGFVNAFQPGAMYGWQKLIGKTGNKGLGMFYFLHHRRCGPASFERR